MTAAAKEARNAYMREWRKKNPERAKAIKARYWERKAAELQSQAAGDLREGEGNEIHEN